MATDHRYTPVGEPHESTPLAEKVSRLRGTLPLVMPSEKPVGDSESSPSIGRTIPGTRIRTTMPESKSIGRTIPGTRIRTTMPEPK